MNLLFVDKSIKDVDIFVGSVNENTKCIVYDFFTPIKSTTKKIVDFGISQYDVIGFAFENDKSGNKFFVSNKYYISLKNKDVESNDVTKFIKSIIVTYNVKTVDFLGIKVRASKDKTGNMLNGGDWILESSDDNNK